MTKSKQFVNYNEKLTPLTINNNTYIEVILRRLMYFGFALSLLGSFGIGWGISAASFWNRLSTNRISTLNYNIFNLIIALFTMVVHGIYLKITLYGYKKIETINFYKKNFVFSLAMFSMHLLVIIITFWYVVRIHVNNFYIAGIIATLIAIVFIYTLIFLFAIEIKRQWKIKKYIDFQNDVKKFKKSENIQYYSKEKQLLNSKISENKEINTKSKEKEWYKLNKKQILKNKNKLKNDKIK